MPRPLPSTTHSPLPHVVVVGGGFAGLEVCHALKRSPCRVSLIDRQNHHLFQPLLYQVATAGLASAQIASPLRQIFAGDDNITTSMEDVKSVDLKKRQITTSQRTFRYDYLVLAAGARSNYFGHDDWAKHSLTLKTVDDATRIRRRVLSRVEEAELTADPERGRALTTVVIVGGGPTGVELAGAFAELTKRVLHQNFRSVDTSAFRIVLVERSKRLVKQYDEDQSDYTKRTLERKGVEVHTGTAVEDIGEGYAVVGGQRIDAATVIWAAGVSASPLTRSLDDVPLDRNGRVLVENDLSLPAYPEVFAAGDLAAIKDPDGNPVPGVAPAALQMGQHVGKLIRAEIAGRPVPADQRHFTYFDKGNMATIGRAAAIADIRGWKTRGLVAWLLWLFVHLLFLVGLENRILTFISWVNAYLGYHRGARIISTEQVARDDEDRTPRHHQPADKNAQNTTPETSGQQARHQLANSSQS